MNIWLLSDDLLKGSASIMLAVCATPKSLDTGAGSVSSHMHVLNFVEYGRGTFHARNISSGRFTVRDEVNCAILHDGFLSFNSARAASLSCNISL